MARALWAQNWPRAMHLCWPAIVALVQDAWATGALLAGATAGTSMSDAAVTAAVNRRRMVISLRWLVATVDRPASDAPYPTSQDPHRNGHRADSRRSAVRPRSTP